MLFAEVASVNVCVPQLIVAGAIDFCAGLRKAISKTSTLAPGDTVKLGLGATVNGLAAGLSSNTIAARANPAAATHARASRAPITNPG